MKNIFDCYDIETGECDGRCQGCSDCLIAESYRNDEDPPTKEQMLEYMEKAIKEKEEFQKWFDEISKDPEFKNKIKNIFNL